MQTEFGGYSLSGALVCVCGIKITIIGISRIHHFTCDKCGRSFTARRPVVQLDDRSKTEAPKSNFEYYIPGSDPRFSVIQTAGTAIVKCRCGNIVYLGSIDPDTTWVKCKQCRRNYSLGMEVRTEEPEESE